MAILKKLGFLLSIPKSILKYLMGLIIITVLLPIAATVFIPFAIFKQLLRKSASYFRSDLGKMVSSVGALLACANVYKSTETKLNIALVIEGTPSKEKARSDMKAAVEAMDPTTGTDYYPELKQNVTKWMGYPFWKNVKNFNFDEHFLWLDNEGTFSYEELAQRIKELSFTPFTEDKALWRLTVYPNFLPNPEEPYYKENVKYSLAIFEVEHCLADGLSLVKCLHKMCGVKFIDVNEKPKKNAFQRLMLVLCILAKLPYDLADVLFSCTFGEVWPNVKSSVISGDHREDCKLKNYFGAQSTLVPFQKIREVRQKHGVKCVSLTIAAFTAAVRNVLFEGMKEADIPKSVTFFIPFPLPGHPEKLRNHV
jgi:hypothetical protein